MIAYIFQRIVIKIVWQNQTNDKLHALFYHRKINTRTWNSIVHISMHGRVWKKYGVQSTGCKLSNDVHFISLNWYLMCIFLFICSCRRWKHCDCLYIKHCLFVAYKMLYELLCSQIHIFLFLFLFHIVTSDGLNAFLSPSSTIGIFFFQQSCLEYCSYNPKYCVYFVTSFFFFRRILQWFVLLLRSERRVRRVRRVASQCVYYKLVKKRIYDLNVIFDLLRLLTKPNIGE